MNVTEPNADHPVSPNPATPNERAPIVLVTSRSFSSGTVDLDARLATAGFEVVRHSPSHELSGLGDDLAEAVGWIAGTGPITADHLSAAPRLRVLARYGVGCDAVDLASAGRAGVVVTNTPGANSDAVAEHALGLLLSVLRRISDGDARLRAGDWSVRRGRQLGGSIVGVIGFGRIGQASAKLLAGLGCRVLVHDPYVGEEAIRAVGYQPASLREIRTEASVVTLHMPGGDRVVDETWVADCMEGQVLVNTARATLVDESALAAGLRDGRLFGYAADTLLTESDGSDESPLLAPDLREQVVLTPHLGAQTVEAVDRMSEMAVDGVLAVLTGRQPAHPVQLPNTAPTEDSNE